MGEDDGVSRPNAVRRPTARPRSAGASRALGAALLLLALTAFVASAPAASAHAKLVSMSPANGATVALPPTQVVLTFSEDLLATSVRIEVHDAEGVPVGDGKPVVSGASATLPLVAGLSAGGYSVAYRVVSEDGHPVSGTSTFTAAKAATTTATRTSTTATGTPPPPTPAETTSATSTAAPATSVTTGGGDAPESGSNLLVRGVGALLVLAVAAGIVVAVRRARGH